MLKPIKILWLEECDSTSRVLKEMTIGQESKSFDQPMVVSAAKQTAGLGRHGRTWQSLPGNLHYSIAIPASMISPELRDILPLVMGSFFAQWLESQYMIRPCLKWPNDIIVDGMKVGGVLCEGSIQGEQLAGVVVGFGLNLQVVPESNAEFQYPVGSLLKCTGKKLLAKDAAASITEFFRAYWPQVSRENVMQKWQHLAIAPDHIWETEDHGLKKYVRTIGVSAEGYLRLAGLELNNVNEDKETIGFAPFEVSSSHHDYRWSVQADTDVLVADVGNTATKLTRIRWSDQTWQMPFSGLDTFSILNADLAAACSENSHVKAHPQLDDLYKWIEVEARGVAPVLHAVSVNPGALDKLQQALSSHLKVRMIQKNPVRLLRSSYQLDQIGLDRCALLESIYYLTTRALISYPVMCVSLGTATTIDMIDGAGIHLGGYISAGMQVSLDAIAQKGSQLPKALEVQLNQDDMKTRWPKNTLEAMSWVPMQAMLAFLKSERIRLAEHCGLESPKVMVVLTGGFAEALHEAWQGEQVFLCKDLVLLGAGILVVNGR